VRFLSQKRSQPLTIHHLIHPQTKNKKQQGLVQSAFLWGYTATQFVGGRLADRVGGRTVLAAGIAFFSLAQAATAAALGSQALAASAAILPAVLAARACVGLGEGVALPSVTSLVTAHVPPGARASALGATFAGFHGGNMAGLLLSPPLLAAAGWRGLFYVAAAAGVPLLAAWLALVPKRRAREGGGGGGGGGAAVAATATAPSTTTSSSPLPPPTIPNFLRSRPVWAIIAANVANHWGYFIFLNWLPSFFATVLGTDLRASAAWSVGPWAAMAAGAASAGLVADWAVAGGAAVRDVRRAVQAAAFLVPAAALALLAWLSCAGPGGGPSHALSPPLACALVTLALGAASLGQFVTNMGDVAPGAAGSLFGLCNTFGCAAGGAGVAGAGALVQATGSFASVFGVTAGLYLAGAALFWAWAEGTPQFA
jgi:MFS family permease